MIRSRSLFFKHQIRPALLLTAAFTVLALAAGGGRAACAQEAAGSGQGSGQYAAVDRERLLSVAKQFVSRVDRGFSEADSYMEQVRRAGGGAGEDVDIPDGSFLLFRPRIGADKPYILDRDIVGFKEGMDAYLSLRDLFAMAGFAINVDAQGGRAEGWFIRENRSFLLDIDAGTVTAADRQYEVRPDDILREEDDIYVLGAALGQWFDAAITPRFSSQYLDIVTKQKWPVEERLDRENLVLSRGGRLPPPSLPRYDKPYEVAQVPNAVVSLGHSYRDPGNNGGRTSHRSRYSVLATGDVAKMTGEAFIGGNDDQSVENVRLNFSRDSDKPEFLGALKARRFEFGDVTPVRLPLTGNSAQELGARVTNRETNAPPQFSTTEFTGNAEPDWDVELYRNDQLIAFETVDENGRYNFQDIELFMGDNTFRLVFYGPQGEIREEEEHLFVDPSRFEGGEGTYDVSLTMNDEQTYRYREPVNPDKGTPHLVASYQKTLNRGLSMTSGLRARQEEDEQKLYLTGGLSAVVGESLVDMNTAVDESGEAALELVGRRRFGRHDARSSLQVNTDGYSPDTDNEDPRVLLGSVSLRGPLNPYIGQRLSYNLSSRYFEQSSGNNRFELDNSLSTRIGRTNYSHNIGYDRRDNEDGVEERLRGAFSARGSMGKTRWRSIAGYELSPETELESLLLDLSRKMTKNLSARFELEHNVRPSLTTGTMSLNWLTDYAVISPRLEIDSENEVFASMNMRFGVTRDPHSGDIVVTNRPVAQRGGVSARVYLDRDGDYRYTEGIDEFLEGVTVKAVHSGGNAPTNEDGIAFLYDLQSNRLTDIEIERGTFDDPFWIPAFEGISVRPRPGSVTEVDFPVHISGEIDGTVYITDRAGDRRPAKGVQLSLYDVEGEKVQESGAAFDGFYLFSQIPPGTYYIVVDGDDAKSLGAARPVPQKVTFDYNGTIIYGHDIYLTSNEEDVPFTIAPDLADFKARHPHIDMDDIRPGTLVLNLGAYHSRLMMAVIWYRLQSRYGDIVGPNSVMVPPSQSFSSVDGERHVLRVRIEDSAPEQALKKCRALAARGLSCGVEWIPAETGAREAALPFRDKKI